MMDCEEVISQQRQQYGNSCIPSGVEMILKVLGRVDTDYYDLQKEWDDRTDGSFADFHKKELFGVRFIHRFFDIPRGSDFPLNELFQMISDELSNGRLVLISLASPPRFHIYVVVGEAEGEFLSISKKGPETSRNLYERRTRRTVRQMGGTDILTYKATL